MDHPNLIETKNSFSESDDDTKQCTRLVDNLNLNSKTTTTSKSSTDDSDDFDDTELNNVKNVANKRMLSKDIIKLSFNFVENNMFLCASENGVYLYNVDPLMLMLKLGILMFDS